MTREEYNNQVNEMKINQELNECLVNDIIDDMTKGNDMIDKNQVIDEALEALDKRARGYSNVNESYAYLYGYTQNALRLILKDLDLTEKQLEILTKQASI